MLRESGHTVGFMGDGINDAAAMKAADIGISVDTAVDVALSLIHILWVTLLGTLFFTVLTFTPAGNPLGLTPLPPVYFGFLAAVVSLYLLWVTLAKSWYIRRCHELL